MLNSWIGKDVVRLCEQVVGKVVTSFVQINKLYKFGLHRFEYAVNYVFSVRSLLAVYNQAIVVCAHTQVAVFKGFISNFYTLPTGPTNTNNLIKGNL